MADFFQNGIITTLHKIGTRSVEDLESEIKRYAKNRPVTLILPALYSEFETPAMHHILDELKPVDYLEEIVLSLSRATPDQFHKVRKWTSELKTPVRIVWNESPRITRLVDNLNKSGFPFGIPGKGRSVWLAMGYVLAKQKTYMIALHDCDIVNYQRELLARLVYPIVSPKIDFDFAKGYYARVTNRLYGRVTRLFFTPLIRTLNRMLGGLTFLEYLDSFRYPLSGEFAMVCHMAESVRIAPDWGLEISTLGEVYLNTTLTRVCQVEIQDTYEHKHQKLSRRNTSQGLMRMSIDIARTLFRILSQGGIVLSESFFRTLGVSYLNEARKAIDKYQALAYLNGLEYDRHSESSAVEAFAKAIEIAVKEYLRDPLGTPLMPSWSRIVAAFPEFPEEFIEAVHSDNKEV